MMGHSQLKLTVCAATEEKEASWVAFLRQGLKGLVDIQVLPGGPKRKDLGDLLFIDAEIGAKTLEPWLAQINHQGRGLFLVVKETDPVPQMLLSRQVDDVVIAPFRILEVLSKIRLRDYLILLNSVSSMNANMKELIQLVQSDVQLAERLHRAKVPKRFPKIKGFDVSYRYLAGLRPGGDHFDLAESKDGSFLSFLYFHSTSYGLSGVILSILMRATLRLTLDRMASASTPVDLIRDVYPEILSSIGARDEVSLLFGIYSRAHRTLSFVNLGRAIVLFARPGMGLDPIQAQAGPIAKNTALVNLKEETLQLTPSSRLVIASDGCVRGVDGLVNLIALLNKHRHEDGTTSLNEMTLAIKSQLEDDALPAQDVTGVVLDVDRNKIQLA